MVSNARMPEYVERSGLSCADWSVVTSPRVREALLAIEKARGLEQSWCECTSEEDRVRTALLRLYAEQGHAPEIAELAARVASSVTALRPLLESLRKRDVIVLDANGDRVVGAYPFTNRETGHRVTLGSHTLNAMCAIDALGVGAMYGRDIEIRSSCRFCRAPIEIATGDQGSMVARVRPTTTVVWSGMRYENGCAADSLCKVIAFFCSDTHLESWRAAHASDARGFRLSIEEALEAGRAIFGPVLARSGAEHAQ